jgi:UDP-N-acetylmuramoylalanine--D-glutamate ligase
MTVVLVVGAARSGVAAARALAARGDRVRLHDRDPAAAPDVPAGVELALGEAATADLLDGVELLVKSPGVPGEESVVAAARAGGIPVWSEVELGFRLLRPGVRLVGVTGTNGKTTTTELTAHLCAGAAAGNVGRALTDVAAEATRGIVVCELSSFQLEDVHTLHCVAAALLNVTPDHLDRHGSFEAYAAAKLRVFERQIAADTAVLNDDDPWVRELAAVPGEASVVRVTTADGPSLDGTRLRGDHNRENAAVAVALARAMGVGEAEIADRLRTFVPPPHRLELVGEREGVTAWNDSKATNPEATLRALTAFPDGRVRLILGGSDKGSDFGPLAAALPGRVRSAYLTGPSGARMRPLVEAVVPACDCGTIEVALAAAISDAEPGDAILLSPACASFDEFRSYEHRGDVFRERCRELGFAARAGAEM